MDEEAHHLPSIRTLHTSIQEPNIKATRYFIGMARIKSNRRLTIRFDNLQEAQQRLEETHREKVTRVMKDWSDLEEKYQDMRLADPKAAQSFKQRMTARFQVSELSIFDCFRSVVIRNAWHNERSQMMQTCILCS